MDYFEIKITFIQPEPWKEIFTSLMADGGCDSFADGENEHTLLCYISEVAYNPSQIKDILENHDYQTQIQYQIEKIKAQNWNKLWESNYESVLINERCYIRAPFHESNQNAEYEIIIEPKMSFGTAHHETTSLMIEYILDEPLEGKKVLDMGAGTGILAILTYKKGAFPVMAVDNDEWAYLNNIENNAKNNTEKITVLQGDAHDITGNSFQVIFANINRNILLADMEIYAQTLEKEGMLFLSGFYTGEDLDKITDKCNLLGLNRISYKVKNNWCAAKFQKRGS